MRISPTNTFIQKQNYSFNNTKKAASSQKKENSIQTPAFKGKYIPKDIKQLTASFACVASFFVFPNPATFMVAITGGVSFLLAAMANFFDDSERNN